MQTSRQSIGVYILSLIEAHLFCHYCEGEKSLVIPLLEEMASNHRYLTRNGMTHFLFFSLLCFFHCTSRVSILFLPFYNCQTPLSSCQVFHCRLMSGLGTNSLCVSQGHRVTEQQSRQSVPGSPDEKVWQPLRDMDVGSQK